MILTDIGGPLLTLTLAAIAVMGSPGPATISVTVVGASFGMRRSFPYAIGLIAGTSVVLVAVSLGVVALILAIPHGAALLAGISTTYILFLAFKIATAPPLRGVEDSVDAPAFLGGFLLAIANPKAYLAIGAVIAGTTVVTGDHCLDALVKVVLLAAMIVVIHLFWLVAGASLSRLLRDPLSSRIISLCLAAALVTASLALQWR